MTTRKITIAHFLTVSITSFGHKWTAVDYVEMRLRLYPESLLFTYNQRIDMIASGVITLGLSFGNHQPIDHIDIATIGI